MVETSLAPTTTVVIRPIRISRWAVADDTNAGTGGGPYSKPMPGTDLHFTIITTTLIIITIINRIGQQQR